MITRDRHWFGWLAALPLVLALGGTAAAAECEQQVRQHLQALQVPQDDVQSLRIVRRARAPNPPTNYGYDAWIRLASCGQGYLVVDMTRHCHVKQGYTRGDCSVSGVSHY